MITWLRTLTSRVWAALQRNRLDAEFDEELTTHLELLVDEHRGRGMPAAEARREALRRLGRRVSLRDDHREQRGLPLLDILAQDVRYALRMLWKSPGFTGVAALSLALGIGANTALFSLVDGLILRSLPVRDPDRLVRVSLYPDGPIRKPWLAFPRPIFEALRADNAALTDIVGFNSLDRPEIRIGGAVEPPRQVEHVSDNFFRDLGVTPLVGRFPEPSDGDAAVISYRLWRDRLGGDANVLGQPVTIAGTTYSIVGVAPPKFHGLSRESTADLWIVQTRPDMQMAARLKPGVTILQAEASLTGVFRQLAPSLPRGMNWKVELVHAGRGIASLRDEYERPLIALTVLAGLVLLIACTNIGHLLTVRGVARSRDIAVRIALGASRSRLVIQSLVESTILAALGFVFAVAFAKWGVAIVLSMLPLETVPGGLVFEADARLLSFAAAVSFISVLLFGLMPAWRASRSDQPVNAKAAPTTTHAPAARRFGRWLVSCQVALSILLLVGAVLFVRTLRNLAHFDLGFTADQLLQVSIDTRGSGYGKGQVGPIVRLLLDRVGAIPGVRSASAIRNPVMQGASTSGMKPGFRDRMQGPGDMWDSVEVTPTFFDTMRISLVRGRAFTETDSASGGSGVVVSEAFVKHYFPNEDPVGMNLSGTTILGIVRDTKLVTMRRPNGPLMYELMRQEPDRVNALEVRTAGDAAAVMAALGDEIRRINPRLLVGIRTMREEIDRAIARERLVAAASGFFGILGLLLVSIGIFGVASYGVAQRTREIGIRMALGARRWAVVRTSLRETMIVFCVGLGAGVIAAAAAVRLGASLMADLLFGLTARDAITLIAAVSIMVAAAVAACLVPARRATGIDPLTAIRCE